jgi:hypothetical protein
MSTSEITIKLSAADLDMLRRIAKSENRRLQDLSQIVFGIGLEMFFCELDICFKKEENELTAEEIAQKKINLDLVQNHNYYGLSEDDRKKTAYNWVETCWTNRGERDESGQLSDNLIEPIAQRIRSFALDS